MAHKNRSNWSPYTARKKQQKGASPAGQNPTKKSSQALRGTHRRPTTIYSQAQAEERITDVFFNHECSQVSREQISQLARFYRLLMENQQVHNFTRLVKLRDIAIKHFIDCLLVPTHTELCFPLLDLGSGPGFPGIPLKILFPDQPIILAEGVQKRVAFLKQVQAILQLDKLEIVDRNINSKYTHPIHGVITRAVEDIGNTLKNVSQCLEVGGKVYFMKGPNVDPEIPVAQKRWSEYYQLIQDTPYTLPHTPHRRRLIVFKKLGPIPLEALRAKRIEP